MKEPDGRVVAYVTYYLTGLSYENAYRKAYSVPDGCSVGDRPDAVRATEDYARVFERLTMDMQEANLTLKDHLEKLAELRDDAHANGKFAAAVQAEVARGKAAGLYTIKHEHTVNNVEQLTEGEIRARLLQIQKSRDSSISSSLIENKGVIDAEFSES